MILYDTNFRNTYRAADRYMRNVHLYQKLTKLYARFYKLKSALNLIFRTLKELNMYTVRSDRQE